MTVGVTFNYYCVHCKQFGPENVPCIYCYVEELKEKLSKSEADSAYSFHEAIKTNQKLHRRTQKLESTLSKADKRLQTLTDQVTILSQLIPQIQAAACRFERLELRVAEKRSRKWFGL